MENCEFNGVLASNLIHHMNLGEILPQDNAPVHKLAETQTWFFQISVDILENWPPNLPDLNIIEPLWSKQSCKESLDKKSVKLDKNEPRWIYKIFTMYNI